MYRLQKIEWLLSLSKIATISDKLTTPASNTHIMILTAPATTATIAPSTTASGTMRLSHIDGNTPALKPSSSSSSSHPGTITECILGSAAGFFNLHTLSWFSICRRLMIYELEVGKASITESDVEKGLQSKSHQQVMWTGGGISRKRKFLNIRSLLFGFY